MTLQIRPLTASDIEGVLALKAQAGWNQTRQDIDRFLFLEPAGCFMGEEAGVTVATAAAFVFGQIGWIAMILVAPSARGRGLGTAMTKHALDYLDSRGVRCARLDATPLGQPIYEKLGFVPKYRLARFAGMAPPGATDPRVTCCLPEELDSVLQLDRRITATARERLLQRLYHESPERMHVFRESGSITGYFTSRAGASHTQLGPGIALNNAAGLALLETVTARQAGTPVYIDIPYENCTAMAWAAERGLTVQRDLTRMSRGQASEDRPDLIWASSGPEKG